MAEAEKSGLMSGTTWRVMVLAVVLGFGGIALMSFYLRSKDKKKETISVAVAAQQIAGGTTMNHGMLVGKEFPTGAIGGNFVSANDIISVEGRVVGVDMDPGQPLYWNAIPLAAQGGYDRYLRPENHERAFAITLSGALSNAAKPGDVIDILGTYAEGGSRQAFEVLPAVTVIDKIGATLVLSVTPDEELLLLAAQPCNLTLSVRSKEEPKEDAKLKPVKLTDVLPKAKELSAVRTARLREEPDYPVVATPAPSAPPEPKGSIHRD
jgi:Flp pilus assembly protein CpaB